MLFLFWVLTPGYTQPKWSYQLVENFCVYLQAKINFIIHFFLEILHFRESSNLTGPQHLAHNSRTRILPDMKLVVKISHNISFHLRLFPVKTNAKIFQKILKNLLWGFFGPILSKFGHLTYPSKTGFLRGEGWNGYSIGNASIFSMWKSRFWLIINISFLVNWDHIRRQQGIFIPVITSYKICQDGTTLNITNLYMKIDSLKELLIIKFRASFSFRHSNKGSHQWNRTLSGKLIRMEQIAYWERTTRLLSS